MPSGSPDADMISCWSPAEGQQLHEIAKLTDAGTIRPVVDKVFQFAQTPDALAYVETGRARGKVVVTYAS